MIRIGKWLACAWPLALTACVSAPAHLASKADALAAQAPAAWYAPLPHGGVPQGLSRWWSQFDDPVLLTLIDAAQAVSPTLSSASARIEQARAARVAAGAAGLPVLDAAVGVQRGRSDLSYPVARTSTVGLQAGWEIDLFGGVAAGREAGQARLEGAQAAWHAARVSVAAEVASGYTALRACEAQVAQGEIDAQSRTETARVTALSAKAGFTAPATAALARASAAQGSAQLKAQRAQCDLLVKGLVALTALDEQAMRERLALGAARLPLPAPIELASLPAALLTQRPDLADAERALVAAAADERAAQARRWPRVSLGGSLGFASVTTGAGTVDGSTWTLGPLQLSLPLFDAGVRRANAAAARATYDDAVLQYKARVRMAVREVEEALVALQSTGEREKDAAMAAQGFAESLLATQARFKGGLASAFEFEDARRTAVAAQSALIELQRERVAAWISLYRALGGGWNEDDAQRVQTSRR